MAINWPGAEPLLLSRLAIGAPATLLFTVAGGPDWLLIVVLVLLLLELRDA